MALLDRPSIGDIWRLRSASRERFVKIIGLNDEDVRVHSCDFFGHILPRARLTEIERVSFRRRFDLIHT